MLRWLSPEPAQLADIFVEPIVIYTIVQMLRFGQQEVRPGAA